MAGWRREFLSNPDKGQVLWVNYEDLKARPHAEIRRVAAHIGIAVDEALVERVVKYSRFDNMKKQAGNIPFFRKGRVGEKKRRKRQKVKTRWCVYVAREPKTVKPRTFQREQLRPD